MTRPRKNRMLRWLCFSLFLGADLCSGQTRLMTYNAGLLDTIPLKEERRDYVSANVGHTDADIICLQEIWLASDVDLIVSFNQLQYPYSYSARHDLERNLLPPCANVSLAGVLFKILANGCTKKTNSGEQAKCILEKTGVMNLPQRCISCLAIAASGGFSPTKISKDCVLTSQGEVNLPGLLVLSKRPLLYPLVKYFLPFTKTTVKRGFIHFQDEYVGDIACTHLTPNLGTDYLEPNLRGLFNSYEDQNFFESVIMEKELSTAPRAVIMGDLNCGPRVSNTNVKEEFQFGYHQFLIAGYENPYIDRAGLCTYCLDNPLTMDQNQLTATTPANNVLDHVLLRGIRGTVVQRVFTEIIPGLSIPPSDHYGTETTVVNKGNEFQFQLLVPWLRWIM
uniref:Uncharacterized protein LOC111137281 n=1 Tax=Crassostrea virginica TaxID=6565 RepID=A0A8B8EXT4_CRAVI|nr:uncharacterized protein LOC111137281 [Crassostrea virginica]